MRGRAAALRWAAGGVVIGGLLALLVWAPAAWLASSLADATGSRLLLADARGSIWRGSAVLVLTGGAGSRDASALPGRLHWTLGLDGAALALRASQACCINGELLLRVVPGLGRMRVELPSAAAARSRAAAHPSGIPPGIAPATEPSTGAAPVDATGATVIGQWPASWLAGLGTPWNTLQPSGTLQLSSPGLTLEQVQGRWRFNGRADVELNGMGSRLSTLDVLGSYHITLLGSDGDSAAAGQSQATPAPASAVAGTGGTTLQLGTLAGPLMLQGAGGWVAGKFRFNGQASAAAGSEAVLGNLLNIIGRRQGAVSVISIG